MNHVQYINSLIRAKLADIPELVVFGQNVIAGSCLGGLTRGVQVNSSSRILQTQNSENTLVGIGFGMMRRGVSSIYFIKQQDFLLLGMDHLVNTYNIMRRLENGASYTIVPIAVDHGYEGPQSCLNNLDDFCSMAHIPGYVIHNAHDAEQIINHHLVAPGFRIISVSNRLFSTELLRMDGPVYASPGNTIFHYARGHDATIVACNFAFPQAVTLWNQLKEKGIQASLFSINAVLPNQWPEIQHDLQQTGRLILLDDSKSNNRMSDRFLLAMKNAAVVNRLALVRRTFSPDWLKPNPDQLVVDVDDVLEQLA